MNLLAYRSGHGLGSIEVKMNEDDGEEAMMSSEFECVVEEEEERPQLERSMGLLDGLSVIIGIEIGSGIFASPGEIAGAANGVLLTYMLWVSGGLIALLGGLCVAELSAAYPASGGPYAYFMLLKPIKFWRFRISLGPMLAFSYTWSSFFAIKSSSQAIIALIFSRYVVSAIYVLAGIEEGGSEWVIKGVAAGTIALLTVVNIVGARWATFVQKLSVIAKFLAIFSILVLGVLYVSLHGLEVMQRNFQERLLTGITHPKTWVTTLGIGLPQAMWAYDGYADLSNVAEEVKAPGRNLPVSILGGTALVMVLYMFVNLSYMMTIPFARIVTSSAIALDTAESSVSTFPKVVFMIASAIVSSLVASSAFGACNGSVLSGGRTLFAAARDKLFPFPRIVSHVNPYTGTPWIALAVQGGWSMLLLLPGNFGNLVSYFGLASYFWYFMTVVTLVLLRIQRGEEARPFRVRPYPLIPILYMLACMVIIVTSFLTAFIPSVLVALFVSLGGVFYWLHFDLERGSRIVLLVKWVAGIIRGVWLRLRPKQKEFVDAEASIQISTSRPFK